MTHGRAGPRGTPHEHPIPRVTPSTDSCCPPPPRTPTKLLPPTRESQSLRCFPEAASHTGKTRGESRASTGHSNNAKHKPPCAATQRPAAQCTGLPEARADWPSCPSPDHLAALPPTYLPIIHHPSSPPTTCPSAHPPTYTHSHITVHVPVHHPSIHPPTTVHAPSDLSFLSPIMHLPTLLPPEQAGQLSYRAS